MSDAAASKMRQALPSSLMTPTAIRKVPVASVTRSVESRPTTLPTMRLSYCFVL